MRLYQAFAVVAICTNPPAVMCIKHKLSPKKILTLPNSSEMELDNLTNGVNSEMTSTSDNNSMKKLNKVENMAKSIKEETTIYGAQLTNSIAPPTTSTKANKIENISKSIEESKPIHDTQPTNVIALSTELKKADSTKNRSRRSKSKSKKESKSSISITPTVSLAPTYHKKRGKKVHLSKKSSKKINCKSYSKKSTKKVEKSKTSCLSSPLDAPVTYKFIQCIAGDINNSFPLNLGEINPEVCAVECRTAGFLFFALPCSSLDCWCGGGTWDIGSSAQCCSDRRNLVQEIFRADQEDTLVVFEILQKTSDPAPEPTYHPSSEPMSYPTVALTAAPTTAAPTVATNSDDPTLIPTLAPTLTPTGTPTVTPTGTPTLTPTGAPTLAPTRAPTLTPTGTPTLITTGTPTLTPTGAPSLSPTVARTPITNDNIKATVENFFINKEATTAEYGPIEEWDVNEEPNPVTSQFRELFQNKANFNEDISSWDISSGKILTLMFSGATIFNADISNWDTSGVLAMGSTFEVAKHFNIDIGAWDTSKCKNFFHMFTAAKIFDMDLGRWDVTAATNFVSMFERAKEFNQDLDDWGINANDKCKNMFYKASEFNQELCWAKKPADRTNMFKDSGGSWGCSS